MINNSQTDKQKYLNFEVEHLTIDNISMASKMQINIVYNYAITKFRSKFLTMLKILYQENFEECEMIF